MKNFTRQNFKTNPLWVRLIIMAFMLLAGTSSAWAAYYLKGGFNSWNTNNELKGSGNDLTTTVELKKGTTYAFKVHDGGNNWYGNNGTITSDCTWTFSTNAGDGHITASTDGVYTFTFNTSTKNLTVVYPKPTYLLGTLTDWTNGSELPCSINLQANTAYEFKIKQGDTWYGNGGTMTADNSKGWTFGSDNQSNCHIQTSLAGDYYFSLLWEGNIPSISVSYPCDVENSTEIRIECISTSGCPNLHAWTSSNESITGDWPGEAMIREGNTNIYYYVIERETYKGSTVNIIFNGNDEPQTADIKELEWGKVHRYTRGGVLVYSDCLHEDCTTAEFSVNSLSDLAVGCTTTASITGDNVTVTWSSSETSVASIDPNTGVITAEAAGETTITATTTDADGFCAGVVKETTLTVKSPSVLVEANKTSLCAGEELILTATVTNAGTGNTYQWYKGDNSISGATSATYTINSVSTDDAETYNVAVSGGILCQAKESAGVTVTVNPIPSAPTFDPAPSYCAGDEITLPIKDNAKNTVTWYDEQGNAAGNPATTAGTYTYKAKATNTNGCVSEDYGTYQYTVKPKVGLAWNEISTSMPINNTQNITTTLTGTGNVVYKSSDNTVISVSGSTLKALKEGKATITATATGTGDYCGEATITKEVTVTCVTVNAPNVTASDICSGSTATLTLNNRQDGVTYKLNSTTGSPIFTSGENDYTTPTLNANTTYKIYASHADACTDNIEGSVSVTVDPEPLITLKEAPTICQGTTITFANYVNTSTGTVTWHTKSDFSDAAITSSKPNATTTYYAKATSGNCTPATASLKVTVDPKPAITLKAGPTICSGTEVTFASYVDASSIGDITWHTKSDFSDAAITSATPSQTTTYYAKATNGVCSTPATASLIVTVKSAPTKPAISLTPPNGNIVSGGGVSTSATLTVTPQDDVTFTLYKDGESTGTTGDSFYNITEAGEYYVIGENSCGDASPKSDDKTITVCTIGSTLDRAEYDPATQKVNLEGTFEVCGKESFHGFQWRKSTAGWCAENKGNENSNYVALGTTTESATKTGEFSLSNLDDSYVFRTYVVPVSGSWVYGNEITVSPCINIATPDIDPVAICAGSTATLTLNNKQNGVTYTLGGTPIFTDGTTHTVRPEKTTTYTITATSTISCVANQTATTTVNVEVKDLPEPPAISSGTTVCPNTAFELPSIGEGNWYAQAEGGAPYGSNTITNGVAATTYYYAEAVKYGCASATRTKYTVNVYEAPVTPVVSFDPTIVGQNKNSVLTISNETYTPGTTAYELYKGNNKVKDITTQNTNVSESEATTHTYTVKATSKACASLTSTSAPVTLTVQEAGAIIAALGDLKVDPQDPVDFVAMYVKNDGLSDFTDQGATKVKGYTWQFSNDGGNTWTACVSTATIGVTNGSDKCNNFRPNVAGKYRCVVKYDVGEQPSNVLEVTGDGSTARTFKGVTMNIPVISVNTGKEKFPTCDGLSGTASKNADVIKEKISVDVKIFNTDGTVYYDRKARMNYRGSSSLNFVKKSYAFCTGKEKTKNDKGAVDTGKENLFGLSNGAKDKDWVLYAAAADPSIMRNRLMFDTFRDMTGGWSVNSMYVELVINGEYKGVYVLMDKITANEKRVNVSWNLDKEGNTTQEGFIVKFDKTDIVDRYENTSGDQKTFKSTYSGHDGFTTYDTQIDQRFEIEYPEKEDIEEEDLENNKGAGDWSVVFNAIKDKFNKFEKELKEGNFSEVQKIIDYESWADWFIITEFGKNIDGYRASNLFVYDGSKPNAKIEARPLWDQELSFNNQCPNYYASYGANNVDGFMVDKSNNEAYNNDASTPFWFTGRYKGGRGTYNGSDQTFKGLLDDPCFVAVVKSRWETHKANALSKATLDAKLTAYTDEMGAAKDREATFWSTRSRETCQCSFGGTTGYEDIDFATSKSAISTWITTRPAGLNTAINALKGLDLTISLTVTPDGGVTTPWEAVMVKVNNPSGYDYDLNYTTNTLDKVEGVIINENNDKYTYRIPRPSTWGTGDGERTAIEYGIEATLLVGEEGSQCGNEIGDELTKASTVITLKDEENDNCTELTD